MCGRAKLASDYSEIRIQLKLDIEQEAPNFAPNWNLAPTQKHPIARFDAESGKRRLDVNRWGLLPFWAKDEKLAYSTFNARGEEVDQKPAFREAFKRGRRCLVPLDAFYEWKKLDPAGKVKQPYAIARADGQLLTMAGLWETWKSPAGEAVRTFTIITCAPNEFMAEIHDRMPVILDPAAWPAWLGETPATADELKALLAPCPSEELRKWPVDRRVGNVKNNDAQCIEPITLDG
jgi:putative SOS response-associated peptidase YedK